ncbi:MAG: hypothetical protein Ct9H300mP7_0420 [Verrucomicrobiota bacterium]|nr:MAG: hypothetical protein Ct9H300mP7_0420 [Verrucomicrobiota bacterium]
MQYKAGKVPQARGAASELLAKARSESTNKGAQRAQRAEAGRFDQQMSAFNAAPSVYKTDQSLMPSSGLQRVCENTFCPTPRIAISLTWNCRTKKRSDLLDVTVDPEN